MSSGPAPDRPPDAKVGFMDAVPRVLVCYASAAGSTRGIAECIADRIRTDLRSPGTAGPEVVCRPAAPDLDPEDFDALIVGSAVHNMGWLPSATSFLGRVAGRGTPVWVFSVGSVEPRGRLTRMLVALERARIERAFPPGFAAREHRVFGGIVVMTGVPLWGRLFWRLIGGRPGDHRNWPVIEEWAAGIASASAGRPGVSPGAQHRARGRSPQGTTGPQRNTGPQPAAL
jgi:menaquinone-dependent protoporphyrinogen oxidase